MADLRWSAPTRAADADWLSLLAAMELADGRGETYTLDDLDDEWSSIWARPATDARFGWDGDELVAFAWLKAMPGEREAHRVSCWGGVRPSHRRCGIGSELFTWMLRQATEVGSRFDGSLPVSVHVDATEAQSDLVLVAQRAGFEPVRHFVEVARSVQEPIPEVPAPVGLELVSWNGALDEEARLAQVEAFTDHWGSEPRNREEWVQWYTGHRSFRRDLSVLAVDRASGEVASLVLCAAYPQDWGGVPVEAWINTVGTRRAWRGKGVARWLLVDALRRIENAADGFERAILGVDEENPTGALRLYRDLGFTTDVRRMTMLARGPLTPESGVAGAR
ncbi:MAG: GNAT family N-acetyltransferase [Microthrixaceae bacterium]